MKKILSVLFGATILYSCSENLGTEDKHAGPSKEKQILTEELPPASDLKQFKWFYSAFVKIITLHSDSALNKIINPEFGLNIIESNGALPHLTQVKNIAEFKTLNKKSFFDFSAEVLICDPKEEDLPKVDCNAKDLYDKTGCFTREVNKLKDQKIWEACNLPSVQADLVAKSARTITRTVVVTANYTYYFSLIKGGWWLTFIDMRRPCQA